MSEDPESRIGATIGNYRLVSVLGTGGAGVVFKAEHVYIGKLAAVKVLHAKYAGSDEAVKRFLREAWAASAISHPNIVDVVDFGEADNGSVFLVMEYIEGQPLDHVLGELRRLDLLRAITIMTQMTSALAAAHALGIYHRDLKPENVLLNRRPGRREIVRRFIESGGERLVSQPEGEFDFVKVLDFGVAKVLQRTEDDPGANATPLPVVFDNPSAKSETIFGTPEYMAPEAASGGAADHRTDIYAAGAMFYEMLTGVVPHEGEHAMDTLLKQITDPVIPPRQRAPKAEITEAAERTIMKALAKDPDQRHQSMTELNEELQSCFGSLIYKRTLDGTAARQYPMPAPKAQPMPLLKPKAKAASPSPEGSPAAPARPLQLTKRKMTAPVPVSAYTSALPKQADEPDGDGGDSATGKPARRGTLPLGTTAVGQRDGGNK